MRQEVLAYLVLVNAVKLYSYTKDLLGHVAEGDTTSEVASMMASVRKLQTVLVEWLEN